MTMSNNRNVKNGEDYKIMSRNEFIRKHGDKKVYFSGYRSCSFEFESKDRRIRVYVGSTYEDIRNLRVYSSDIPIMIKELNPDAYNIDGVYFSWKYYYMLIQSYVKNKYLVVTRYRLASNQQDWHFETVVWEWYADTKQRGNLVDVIDSGLSEISALGHHSSICNDLISGKISKK